MVQPPWQAPWSELTLDHLREFFAEAGDEGLTWEAKGTERISNANIRRHTCGFANQLGGYLVLGARRAEGNSWILDGVPFPDEAAPWLRSVAAAGLSPVPTMDAKGWGVAEGRSVAVLRVEPVAAPPCMWDGRVFQRVTGATEPVTDQSVMAEPVHRGRAARERAERSARDLAASLVKVPTDAPSDCTRLAVAVSPIGPAASWAERLFTLPVQTRALRAISRWSRRHRTHVDASARGQHGVDYAAYTVEISEFGRVVWGVVCMDDGTVGAWSEQPERMTVHDLDDTYLGRPWRAALGLARGGESSGPAFVAFATGLGARPGPGDLPLLEPPVVLGVQSLEDPAESDVERVQRMIRRVGGEVIFDPAGAEETSST